MLNTPGDVLYPQLTTGVYWTLVFNGLVSSDMGHLQGYLAWVNTLCLVDFFAQWVDWCEIVLLALYNY